MKLEIPQKIKGRLQAVQQNINALVETQQEILRIFLDTIDDLPNTKAEVNKEGTHVIFEEEEIKEEENVTDSESGGSQG